MYKINGRIFTKISSQSTNCTMHCQDDGTIAFGETHDKIYQQSDIYEITDRLGSIPRRIIFHDGVVFETPDNDSIDTLFSNKISWIAKLSDSLDQWRKPLIFLVIATVLAVFLFFKYGLPVGARIAAFVTPDIVAQTIDSSALETIDSVMLRQSKLPTERQHSLTEQFENLVLLAQELNYPHIDNMQLLFRDGGSVGANAFALPGGTVIATDQFIQLAENDDEIIAVLAHEIGHVRHQHSLRQIYEAMGLYAMFTMIGGGGIDLSQEVVSQAAIVFQFSASREFETQSDDFAIELLKAGGHDPSYLANILRRLTKKCEDCEDGPEWLSTHPAPDERVKAIIDKSR